MFTAAVYQRAGILSTDNNIRRLGLNVSYKILAVLAHFSITRHKNDIRGEVRK
jgi:hypothetical protein